MAVRTWAYWLQNVDPASVASSPLDLVVVDRYNNDGVPFSKSEVTLMGGGTADPRLALAYMSVGEAETYRSYWQDSWSQQPPSWLGPENPDWDGNYQVRYWQSGWQTLLYQYLDGILAAGFDGAFFDVVDVYQSALAKERPDPAKDMIDLVVNLSNYAKAINPNFKIYINNAEELLGNARYLAAIDGVNKEGLYFDSNTTAQTKLSASDVEWSKSYLLKAKDAGKTVLTIEYVTDPAKVAYSVEQDLANGFGVYTGPRDLDYLDLHAANLVGTQSVSSPVTFATEILAADTGRLANDFVTQNGAITLGGHIDPGYTLKLYDNGTAITPIIAADQWQAKVTLAQGVHTLKVVATGPDGMSTTVFAPAKVVVDTTAPVLSVARPVLAKDTGRSSTDLVTSDGRVTLFGKTEAGLKVTVTDAGRVLGSVTADAKGAWSFKTVLGQGAHALKAQSVDAAGNATIVSATPVTVDTKTSAPAVKTLAKGTSTALTGTAEAGAVVVVKVDGVSTARAVADKKGAWSASLSTDDASHALQVVAVDRAGNTKTSFGLMGTNGGDTLASSKASEVLAGLKGADTFAFQGSFGRDRVVDFQVAGSAHDKILFGGGGLRSWTDVQKAIRQVGTDTVITDGTSTLTLSHVNKAALTKAHFLFDF